MLTKVIVYKDGKLISTLGEDVGDYMFKDENDDYDVTTVYKTIYGFLPIEYIGQDDIDAHCIMPRVDAKGGKRVRKSKRDWRMRMLKPCKVRQEQDDDELPF